MKIIADENIPEVHQAFAHLGEVILVDGRCLNTEQLHQADALIVRSVTRVDEALLADTPVQFVGSATIGTDHVDLDYLNRAGIAFANAPGCNATSATEYVVAALFKLAQRRGLELPGMQVGVVGNGNVGSRVVTRLEAIGCEVYVYDPPRERAYNDREYVDWARIKACDVVTAHVPLTQAGDYPTYRMFDAGFFTALPEGAIFINTSRGGAVDEAALKARLASERAMSAVLDVWQKEPAIDIELLQQVEIATPHIAGYSREGKFRGLEMVYNAACRYFEIQPQWSMQQVLPELHRELPAPAETDVQTALSVLIEKAYDIDVDDAALKAIAHMPPTQRASYFDHLRRSYRERREFFNYCLRAKDYAPPLRHQAQALGFTVID